jgi:hypothetical protein
MGCYSTKDSKNIDPPVNSQSSQNRRYSTHYGNSQPSLSEVPESLKGKITWILPINQPQVEEPESLKGFNVVYTDFIGEKTGKITDFYTLLNPPIGKGIEWSIVSALLIMMKALLGRLEERCTRRRTWPERSRLSINRVQIKRIEKNWLMKWIYSSSW